MTVMSGSPVARPEIGLDDFAIDNAVWDPMPLWDGRRFLLYVLAMDRACGLELGSFFTRENTIEAFESADGRRWRHLGTAIRPRHPAERLCAGNPVYHDGRYWFFGSATVDQYDADHLDQRVFLMVSEDGLHFDPVTDFSLEPDPAICPHNRFHPLDGRMLFAWRDPWPVFDAEGDRWLLFICTGGERWRRVPDVVVAEAPRLSGPYRILGSALVLPGEVDGSTRAAFAEIERVNVIPHGDRWFLTFSCWRRLVDEELVGRFAYVDEALTDCTVYAASSAAPCGPFVFAPGRLPYVRGSRYGGCYGTTFYTGQDGSYHAMGWEWPRFVVRGLGQGLLNGLSDDAPEGPGLAMQWSTGYRVRIALSGFGGRIARLLAPALTWPRRLVRSRRIA